jgi:hypothetical protein
MLEALSKVIVKNNISIKFVFFHTTRHPFQAEASYLPIFLPNTTFLDRLD